MGDIQPNRRQSSRQSVFSDGQFVAEESRVPIHEPNNSRMQHLAVKSNERYDSEALGGLYIATLIFIRENGNWTYGSKLNSPEPIRQERGKVIGGEECKAAEVSWGSVDVRDRYHGMKLKISKHAFASPFGMMEMLMMINPEKEPNFKIRVGQAGNKEKYATLNIMGKYAGDMIKYQLSLHEKDDTNQLQKIYSERFVMPSIAYLKRDGFGQESQENELINGLMRESLSGIIYVEPFGATTEIPPNSICQQELCPCRLMMRYVRGFKSVKSGG